MKLLSQILSRSSTSRSNSCGGSDESDMKSEPIKTSPLLTLPTEILLLLEDFLVYEHAISFSLTCKQLYLLFFKRQKPTSKHTGREANLLRILERDLPDHLVCAIHEKFYSWRKTRNKHYQCPQCSRYPGRIAGSVVVCNKGCKSGFYGIFEAERRLLLRHALLGPAYGVPQRLINHVCKRSNSARANEVRSRVNDGRLMIWRTHHFSVSTNFKNWSDAGLERFNESICVHSERNLKSLLIAALCHARSRDKSRVEDIKRFGTKNNLNWICPTLFKCEQCSTDIRLRLHQNVSSEATIRLDAYQDLGGLNKLTTSQRQVFGFVPWRQGNLSEDETIKRLEENLEDEYYGWGLGSQVTPSNSALASKTANQNGNACFLPIYTQAMLRHDPPRFSALGGQLRSDTPRVFDFIVDEDFE